MSHYRNPRDPRLLAECAAIHKDAVPCKVWSPDGTFFTATCATHEEIAGSFVADGMPQEEYWPQVVLGYRASVRGYIDQTRRHIARIEELGAKLEQIETAWNMALYGDLEHGVASLNEKAHRAFNKGYPNIAAFGSDLERILYEGEKE